MTNFSVLCGTPTGRRGSASVLGPGAACWQIVLAASGALAVLAGCSEDGSAAEQPGLEMSISSNGAGTTGEVNEMATDVAQSTPPSGTTISPGETTTAASGGAGENGAGAAGPTNQGVGPSAPNGGGEPAGSIEPDSMGGSGGSATPTSEGSGGGSSEDPTGEGAGGAGTGGAGTGEGTGGASTGEGVGGAASGEGSAGGAGGSGADAPPDRSAGCGTSLMRPQPNVQQTVEINGTTRYYLLDVPADADNDTPLSLVFALHGFDMNNVSVVGLFNFTSRSNGRVITVYPQGEGPPPGDTSHWGDGVLESRWDSNEENFAFFETLIQDMQDRYCIDPGRIFMTGFSMGGLFTNAMACEHPDWFRAFAPVEGVGPGTCANADAKPPVMVHQGTRDSLVTEDRGEETRDFWAMRNSCDQATSASYMGCESFEGCEQPVVYCLGDWDHTITATATSNILSFFDEFE